MSDLLKDKLTDHVVIFDGASGTEFYKRNFFVNTSYENLNLTSPDIVSEIYRSYVDAGAEVLTTNSYGANRKKLARFGLAEKTVPINIAAAKLARQQCTPNTLVAGSVGPVGKDVNAEIISPEEAIEVLGEQICALQEGGVDFILFETLSSLNGLKCALKAVEKFASVPYVLSFAVDRELESAYGEPLSVMLSELENVSTLPTAIGLNCSIGPEAMLEAVEKLLKFCRLPIIVQPNAGMPKNVDNRMIYMCSPEYLTTYALRYVNLGVRGIGGCCGIGPEHIRDLDRSIKPLVKKSITSSTKVTTLEVEPQPSVPIAERSKLAAKIARGEFVTSVEITPPRGFDLTDTINKARLCQQAGIDAINIPDGPRASSRISPIITAHEIQEKAGIEVVLHCCCRDKNLIGIQADLLGCAWQQINNILFITGDPPKLGDYPFASAVFDVDSIGILKVASRLNQGIDIGGKSIGAPTRIFGGAGADPNAIDMDREIERTKLKIEAGAEFIITQPAFSSEPILNFMERLAGKKVPIIVGIWPLASLRNAEFLRNEVPGVVIPDSVMKRMSSFEQQSDQRKVGIEIAREAVERLRGQIQGIQVSAPFGNVNSAIEVIRN